MSNSHEKLMRYDAEKRSVIIAYLLWFFLGYLAFHRFYLSRWISGLIFLALMGIGFVLSFVIVGYLILAPMFLWWLIDALLIPGMVSSRNREVQESGFVVEWSSWDTFGVGWIHSNVILFPKASLARAPSLCLS